MTAPPYASYKESGVDWLGTVPQHWGVEPIKWAARPVTRKAESRKFPVALENIEGWSGKFVEMEADYEGDGVSFECGDILFGKLRPYLAKAWLADRAGEAIGDFHVLRAAGGYHPGYLQKLILTREVISQIDGSTFGAKMPRASWEFIRSLHIPRPSLTEQSAILDFVDREVAKIDTLITEQERLTGLLKEKRQVAISLAVTKGLNPTVPMKDSGSEWAGQTPRHWSVCRLGYYASVENGSTPSRDTSAYWEGGTVPWVSSGEVNQYVVVEPSELISEAAVRDFGLRLFPEDSVLVGLIGQGRTRGMSALLGISAAINQNVAAITTNPRLSPRYLHYLFQGAYESLREYGRGGNQAALNCEILKAFRILLPPTQEQAEIVRYLDTVHAAVTALVAEAGRTIRLLKERRSALISAAVTGKIDVRGLAGAVQEAA